MKKQQECNLGEWKRKLPKIGRHIVMSAKNVTKTNKACPCTMHSEITLCSLLIIHLLFVLFSRSKNVIVGGENGWTLHPPSQKCSGKAIAKSARQPILFSIAIAVFSHSLSLRLRFMSSRRKTIENGNGIKIRTDLNWDVWDGMGFFLFITGV